MIEDGDLIIDDFLEELRNVAERLEDESKG